MATAPRPPYDPVKSVAGMFHGSVTRISYALKDPVHYAQGTGTVLAQTAKLFQDALDDCELQILDAKWYLEHQLAVHRARREAKAREESALTAKRKHAEIHERGDLNSGYEPEEKGAKKRVKVSGEKAEEQNTSKASAEPAAPLGAPATEKSPQDTSRLIKTEEKASEATSKETKEPASAQAPVSGPGPEPTGPEKPAEVAPAQNQTNLEDFSKAAPEISRRTSAEDFSFVSMFADSSADQNDESGGGGGGGDGGNDVSFDLSLIQGDSFHNNHLQDQDPSLNALLPGLDSYTHQGGNDTSFSMGDTAPTTAAPPANDHNAPTAINHFNLPDLHHNEFDDLFNDDSFSGTNFDENMNLDDDTVMNMDMDFDSMFE